MRIHCWVFGCRYAVYNSLTCRCGAEFYDQDWIYEGWIERTQRWWRRWTDWVVGHKCGTCGKRFRNGATPYCCSRECADAWIPF